MVEDGAKLDAAKLDTKQQRVLDTKVQRTTCGHRLTQQKSYATKTLEGPKGERETMICWCTGIGGTALEAQLRKNGQAK